jgi:serine protease Do
MKLDVLSPARRAPKAVLLSGVAALMLGGIAVAEATFDRASAAPVGAGMQVTVAAPSFADLADAVKPAVVSVRVKTQAVGTVADRGMPEIENLPPQIREFLRRFGQEPQGRTPRGPKSSGESQGSGFFVSEDGYVVTNNHVVENGVEVTLVTDDGRTVPAEIVGTDPRTDLALLKAKASGPFPYVKLASTAPRVGDWVMAVGNPFGLGGTVTTGIVSARGRDIGAGPYDDFLQIDASVNRGNSGGPTFDTKGEVVGVNTAIVSPSGGSVGIAFAIPSTTVSQVVAALKEHGTVERGYLGVHIQPITPDIAENLGLKSEDGALVAEVTKGSAAEKAGLKAGDVVTAFDGKAVKSARDLTRLVGTMKPGARAKLTFLRDGHERSASVELARLPEAKPRA